MERKGLNSLAKAVLTISVCLGVAHAGQNKGSAEQVPSAPVRQAEAPCPPFGWKENLHNYLPPDAQFPSQNTPLTAVDCDFHEWSWEAFVWATARGSNGMPRFMTLPTTSDLLTDPKSLKKKKGPGLLKLAARSATPHGVAGFTEGAGAIVEADGNMLVAPNGYPVYASVHMTPSYFDTARKNLIATGGYQSQPADSYFNVGDAVFKAMWMRLEQGQSPPPGAFVTKAQVPVLHVLRTKTSGAVAPNGQYETVRVALVGLHVVGYTINHPEFLWGTFEHRLNAPMLPDNSFKTSGSDPNNYTFYQANTPFSQVNLQNSDPATLNFDLRLQKFTPATNAVQQNSTGGENNSPQGPQNIMSVNGQGQAFMQNQQGPQSLFANYSLIGTVWMLPNSYSVNSGRTDAVGSVNLANTTAETFVQAASNSSPQQWRNCFMCHNARSYSFQSDPPPLANRLIAISHVLAEGTPYAVPNVIPVQVPRQKLMEETP
ncbi:MAG TPA: hypothetical protein VFX02_10745 [Gammaproteobacteria bacterium]|nr:hypothetical protein [Gammaproteobacteria bacterium]